ncbi:hypothetical protein [Rhizobium leguminosarum]|uniref:Uncharacterized protein n=1 Tax=Rhizobium leguminosarum TaxID=384 RepID=A0A1B1C8B3_RHILE|nr:hypothetical protein [Rhizobium leguminosarum]ANP86032.1 hypothetical protein BA011_10040 [Rhizobium leguminosarum]
MKPLISTCALFLSIAAPVWADDYDTLYRGLTAASYRHLQTTYNCRAALGPSAYREARITAENVLRISGVATDIALNEVDRMVAKIETGESDTNRTSLNPCLDNTRRSLSNVRAWQKKVAVYWQ